MVNVINDYDMFCSIWFIVLVCRLNIIMLDHFIKIEYHDGRSEIYLVYCLWEDDSLNGFCDGLSLIAYGLWCRVFLDQKNVGVITYV